jgi:hypothetical protein
VTIRLLAALLTALITASCSREATVSGTPAHFQQQLARTQALALSVNNRLGAGITVIGSSGREVTFDATPCADCPSLKLYSASERGWLFLRLDPVGGTGPWRLLFNRGAEATIFLRVPRDATLSLTATNGAVSVRNTTGPVSVRLVNGPISVDNSGSVLSLHTVNGPVDAGVADLSRVANLDLSATNGSINLSVPKNFKARFDVRTVIGSIDQHVPSQDSPGRVRIRLGTGPITIEER